MKEFLSKLVRDALLLWQTPKNYLYTLISIPNSKVKLYPYSSKSEKVASDVIKRIKISIKGATVEFVGSAALKLPGYKDIDLFIPVSASKLSSYENALVFLFGTPDKHRKHFSEWHFLKDGYMVELMLIEKNDRAYVEQKIVYETLRKNSKSLEEYKALKLSSVGISKKEYQKRRMAFYNRIVNEYDTAGNTSRKFSWQHLSLSQLTS